ncbi:uncharacterized protein Z518_01379 [Rhinocladiella mackenziei CBS 650.93]|uniref:Rhinocladiella mackenziei CBS 650.93 unplaced genomic scaffold supercont1.1, whole genome shotgun sequence n=1 Tax=Rhinocladiella mackenziei CBS 650.93 TaxID=1442369 RepID=A0A0D2G5U5_9EURO|nr:uncharacterized protein Z518_01379 [Rhinocladiella mackenziei CBS 650.93]KIX10297.1 hypothetical protein Z518_01379 [Rhinocladiella mackenziei CBS 650.93]
MVATTDPASTSNRIKNQSLNGNVNPPSAVAMKPTPMARITQSAELDEYTARMRSFLASVEESQLRRDQGVKGMSLHRGESDDSGSGNEREKSPEFCWMDLASVRREHGGANLSGDDASGVGISEETTKLPPHHPLGILADARHHHYAHHNHHHHRGEHRSASPGGKSLLSKRYMAHAPQAPMPSTGIGRGSAEKHCNR